MWLLPAFLCFAVTGFDFASAQDGLKNYNGYKTYNLTLDTEEKRVFVRKYEELEGFDFWLRPNRLNNNAHLMVAPDKQAAFKNELRTHDIAYKTLHDNVGQLIAKDERSSKIPKVATRAFFTDNNPKAPSEYKFDHFPRYNEIISFMKSLTFNKTYTRLIIVGNSSEGRPIYGVEVKKHEKNPVFVIDAGIHPREWASHIAAMYIMKQVILNEEVFADRLSLVIIPCLNPDGYEYSHTNDRLWRKSRSKQEKCMGVDLNRNFDSHWGEFRSEKLDSCDRLFAGKHAFSEPESVALRDTILYYKPVAYLTMHSFGGYILYPWGFTKNPPPNWKTLHTIASNVVGKLKEMNGTTYKYGSSAVILYEASGASDDWAMEKGNVSLVFTMELPAYSNQYFVVPENKIQDLVLEAFEAFIVLFNEIYRNTL